MSIATQRAILTTLADILRAADQAGLEAITWGVGMDGVTGTSWSSARRSHADARATFAAYAMLIEATPTAEAPTSDGRILATAVQYFGTATTRHTVVLRLELEATR